MVERFDTNDKRGKKDSTKDKDEYVHFGHRRRMRERYKKYGLDSFEFHEILEMMLYYCIPRADTNSIAHEMEQKFGKSLSNVLEADINALMEIKGISENTAMSFKFATDIIRMYNIERASKPNSMTDKSVQEKYLIARYTGINNETVVMISMNNRMERIADDVIYVGNMNSTKVDLHKIVKIAMKNNAANVIISHNHPNGCDYPSIEDIETTKRIKRIFDDIHINFVDHYVVAGTKISSIKDKLIY